MGKFLLVSSGLRLKILLTSARPWTAQEKSSKHRVQTVDG